MSIIPKAKKDLRTLTKHNREKELKRLRAETDELIDEMGQRSDLKAIPTVREYTREQDSEETLSLEIDNEQLEKLSKNKVLYQRYLVKVLNRFVGDEGIPKKYSLYVDSNDKGIALGISGTDLVSAFSPMGLPKYDINACKILAVQLGNTVGKLEGNFTETDSGIAVATEKELKLATKYGRTSKS